MKSNLSYIHYIARLKQIVENSEIEGEEGGEADNYLNITSKFILNKLQSFEKEESQSIYEKVIEKAIEKINKKEKVTLDHIYEINQEIIPLIAQSDEIFLEIEVPNKIHELECLNVNDLDSRDYENIIQMLKRLAGLRPRTTHF
jgi:hypothetical protein